MDSERHLSPTAREISDLLSSLPEARAWGVESFDLVDHWERPRSGSSFYRMVGVPDGPDLVVKSVPDWGPGMSRLVFEAMIDLDDAIAAHGVEGASGIRPIAWSDSPPALVMPYVESADVVSVLRQPEHEAWKNGDLERWMERAGEMLAAYHQTKPTGWEPDIGEAGTEVRGLAGKVRVSKSDIESILGMADWRARARRRYGDYGPGNLQGSGDGALYLLDPPESSHTSLIHRDISNFLFELRRQLAGHGYTRSAPVRGWYPDFRQRFLHGYLRHWPGLEIGEADEALIALFEIKRATAMARKRFPERPGDAAWFARLAARRRFDLSAIVRRMG